MHDDGIVPLSAAQEAVQEARTAREGYIHRDLVALDQAANVVCDGVPDETISSRLARAAERGSRLGILGSKLLDLFQRDHGAKAQAGDRERAGAVIALEDSSPGWNK